MINGVAHQAEVAAPVVVAAPAELRIDTLPPEHLHAAWPLLERGLSDIVRKAASPPDWKPMDVYAYLRMGQAVAYLAFYRGRYVAFAVCYVQTLPFSGRKEFIVWCGWGIPLRERTPEDDTDGVWQALWNHMREAGRRAGAVRLATLTTRPGYGRQAAKVGLTTSFTRYECVL